MKEFDIKKDANLIGHELDTSYTRNGTTYNISDLRLDIESPSYSHDRIYVDENSEYI